MHGGKFRDIGTTIASSTDSYSSATRRNRLAVPVLVLAPPTFDQASVDQVADEAGNDKEHGEVEDHDTTVLDADLERFGGAVRIIGP